MHARGTTTNFMQYILHISIRSTSIPRCPIQRWTTLFFPHFSDSKNTFTDFENTLHITKLKTLTFWSLYWFQRHIKCLTDSFAPLYQMLSLGLMRPNPHHAPELWCFVLFMTPRTNKNIYWEYNMFGPAGWPGCLSPYIVCWPVLWITIYGHYTQQRHRSPALYIRRII